MALYDARGKEVAYNDDYRFQPDPVIFYEVPKDGEYVLAINDAIYRGREDFVYRVTIGELPFPDEHLSLGRPGGPADQDQDEGLEPRWGRTAAAARGRGAGNLSARRAQQGICFQPPCLSPWTRCRNASRRSPTTTPAHAQKVTASRHHQRAHRSAGRLGRVPVRRPRRARRSSRRSLARRLDSPLDSLLKLTDATGKLLAFNDDHEDPEAGVEHARCRFVPDGPSCPRTGPTTCTWATRPAMAAKNMPTACGISAPRPDFALICRALQRRSAQQEPAARHRLRRPQRRVCRPHQTRPERSAGRVLVVARFPVGDPDVGAAHREDEFGGNEEPVRLVVEGRAQIGAATSSMRRCRRKTGCRRSCGGISFRRKNCGLWSSTRRSSLRPNTSAASRCCPTSSRKASRRRRSRPLQRRPPHPRSRGYLRSPSSPSSRSPDVCGNSSCFLKRDS